MDYTTPIKNGRMAYTNTQIGATGYLAVGTDTMDGLTDPDAGVLVRVPFSNPAFTIAAGVMSANALPLSTEAEGTGIAAKAEIRAGDDTVIANNMDVGLITDPDVDVHINALEVSTGQLVQITIGNITHG